MKRLYKIVLFLTLLLLCACTPYKPMGFNGMYIDGYENSQYDENVFRVSFDGNVFDRYNEIYNMNLYRCAELTIESNYRYFVIIKEENSPTLSYSNFISRMNPWQGPQSVLTIACYKDKPLEFSYDANFILYTLNPDFKSQKVSNSKERGYFITLWNDFLDFLRI